MVVGRDQYWHDSVGRSLRADCGSHPAQIPDRAGGTLWIALGYHVLHAARGLVRSSVCDNFYRRDHRAVSISQPYSAIMSDNMLAELEQQYTALKTKVHDLREYL